MLAEILRLDNGLEGQNEALGEYHVLGTPFSVRPG